MSPTLVALLAPLAASLAGWMLSGSPVPMALTLFVLVAGFVARPFFSGWRDSPVPRILPAVLAGAALWLEVALFREGLALALRAEMPAAYHAGLSLLWWAAVEKLFATGQISRPDSPINSLGAIVGGLLVFASSAGTVLYDFAGWQVHPLSALPLALWLVEAFRPRCHRPGAFPAAALVALLLASLIPVATVTTEVLAPLFSRETSEATDTGALSAPGLESGSPLADGASRSIPREGDVRFRQEILVRIKAHSPALYHSWTGAPLYLRTSTLALFDSEETLSPIRSGRWIYDLDDGEEDQAIPLAYAGASRPLPRTGLHTTYVGRDATGHLPLLAHASEFFAPALYEFADGWFQLSPPDSISLLRYTTAAAPGRIPAARPSDLIDSDTSTGAELIETAGVYLQLPPSPLSARVRELCATFPTDDRLGAIRRHLETSARYTLKFKCPDDSSPLADFLFGKGHGHCEHYAAATVLMLRSLGIPSRVSYGYAGGLADASQRTVAFRDNDFHAWAEILSNDGAWKIFDTTPRVASAAARTPGAADLPGLEEELYHDLSQFDGTLLERGSDLTGLLASLVAFLSRFFFPATAVGIFLLFALWRVAGRGGGNSTRHAGRRDLGKAEQTDLPPWLLEIERIAGPLGAERRPGETWREFTEALGARIRLSPAVSEAVSYHYHLAYAGGSRDAGKERRLLESLRDHPVEDRGV